MKDLLEEIFCNYAKNTPDTEYVSEMKKILRKNRERLNELLDDNGKRLLLKTLDAKTLISEEQKFDSFIYGFKLGLKFGYETNRE